MCLKSPDLMCPSQCKKGRSLLSTKGSQLQGQRKVSVLEETPTQISHFITALKTQASFMACRQMRMQMRVKGGISRHHPCLSVIPPLLQYDPYSCPHIHATSGNGARGGSITCRHTSIRFIRQGRPL